MLPHHAPPHRTLLKLVPLLAALLSVTHAARGQVPTSQPSNRTSQILIVLAGDSTVTDSIGWGKGFQNLLRANVVCVNEAKSGRSSRNYLSQGWWTQCLALKPDYILIQFGHNDMRKGEGRDTDPQTTYKQFMSDYVDQARAAGVKPVLVTSMSRRIWGPDGKIHSNLQAYVDVVKQIAADKQVPLIDLHARSIELYEKLGQPGCNAISPQTDKGFDPTHLNPKGGQLVGAIVADELKRAIPELSPDIISPTETPIAVRPDSPTGEARAQHPNNPASN